MVSKDLISCVVVTFNPDTSSLSKVLESILKNGVDVIVVDNGSLNIVEIDNLLKKHKQVTLIALGKNQGIAVAQNIGIKKAIDRHSAYVWLSDQDTIYPDNYTQSMKSCINKFETTGTGSAAAYGPTFIDTTRNHVKPFVKLGIIAQKFQPAPGPNIVSHLIASGMIIPTEVFNKVGLKREDLFIDWVDVEWCLRAEKKHGLKIVGCGDATITHTLGYTAAGFAGFKFNFWSPFRNYFIIRNGIYLALHSDSLYFNQRMYFLWRSFAYLVLYPLVAPSERSEHIKSVWRGFWHGLIKSLGPKH